MPLNTLADIGYEYTALLAPRTLEPNALLCTARQYPEAEEDPIIDVVVRYRGSALQFIAANGTPYAGSITMVKPDKIDAAFDHNNLLNYAWMRDGTLYKGDEDIGMGASIADVTGFALVHEDLRFSSSTHRAALYYTVGTSLFARYSTDAYASATLLHTVNEGEYLYTAGLNEDYRMHFTLRSVTDEDGASLPTPEYVITSGERIVQYNNGAVFAAGD